MKLRVTAKDIAGAEVCNPDNCPIARAARRAGFKDAWVGAVGGPIGATLHFTPREGGFTDEGFRLPQEAHDLAKAFDDEKPVKPIAFDLEVPAPSVYVVGLHGEEP